MEGLILESYLEYKGKKKLKDNFLKMKIPMKIVVIVLVISLICSILAIIFGVCGMLDFVCSLVVAYICLIIECICIIFQFCYSQKERRTCANANKKIKERKQEYEKVYEKWLCKIEYREKVEIEQLCYRCEMILEEKKKERENDIKMWEKAFTIFLVPTCLAIITYSFELDGSIKEHLVLAMAMATIATGIYMLMVSLGRELKPKLYKTV